MAIYKKQALVIGNDSYVRRPLATCVNDATDLSHCRRSIGFQTRCEINLRLNSMEAITRQFIQSIQSGSIVMFYFSSHGIQYDGINYLSPTDKNAHVAGHLDQDQRWSRANESNTSNHNCLCLCSRSRISRYFKK